MKYNNDIENSEIIFGDNLAVMADLPVGSVSLIVTDPPYKFTKSVCRRVYKETSKRLIANSALYDYEDTTGNCRINIDFGREQITAWLDSAERLMRKMNAYIFCSEAQLADYIHWAEEHRYKFAILLWEKPVTIISKRRYSQNVEFVIRIYDMGTSLNKVADIDMYSRVFHAGVKRKKLHPTEKPVGLVERYIMLSSNAGDTILDPFLGSGTTAVAALTLGRKYIGIDNNERFYNVAKHRLAEHHQMLSVVNTE